MGKSRVVTTWSREGAKRIDQRNKKTEHNQRLAASGGRFGGADMSKSLYTGTSEPNEDGVYVQRDVYYSKEPSSISTDKDGNQKANYELIGVERIMKDGKPLTHMVKETDENGNEVEREREVYLPRSIKLSKSLYKRADKDALSDDGLEHAISRGEKINLDLLEDMRADAWNDIFGKTAPVEYLGAAWAGMADGVPFNDVPALDTLPTKEDALFSRKSMTDEERNQKARAEQLADYTEDGQDRSDAGSSVEGRKPSYMLFGFESKEAFHHALKLEKSFDKAVQRNDKNIVRNFTDEDFETVINLKATREKINADFEGRDAEESKAASDSAKKKFENDFSSIKGGKSDKDISKDTATGENEYQSKERIANKLEDVNQKDMEADNGNQRLIITMKGDVIPKKGAVLAQANADRVRNYDDSLDMHSLEGFGDGATVDMDIPDESFTKGVFDAYAKMSDKELMDRLSTLRWASSLGERATGEDNANEDNSLTVEEINVIKSILNNRRRKPKADSETQSNILGSLKDRKY